MEFTIDKIYLYSCDVDIYCQQDNFMRCKYLFPSRVFNHENYYHQLAIYISTPYSVGSNVLFLVYNIQNGFCTIAQVD